MCVRVCARASTAAAAVVQKSDRRSDRPTERERESGRGGGGKVTAGDCYSYQSVLGPCGGRTCRVYVHVATSLDSGPE